VLAYHIREGAYGNVRLDGLNVLAVAQFDGNIWTGEAHPSLGLYIDARADERQRDALVAYLGLADNSRGPLLSRLRGLSPLVVRSQNGLSAPYAALLSCLSTHRSCLLTYRSRAVGRSFSWFIRYRTWGCGQGGTR
jgi:Protein of unknown function (DUF1326)